MVKLNELPHSQKPPPGGSGGFDPRWTRLARPLLEAVTAIVLNARGAQAGEAVSLDRLTPSVEFFL